MAVTVERCTEIWRPALLQFLSESAETDDQHGNPIRGRVGECPEIFGSMIHARAMRWGLTLEVLGSDALIPLWAE